LISRLLLSFFLNGHKYLLNSKVVVVVVIVVVIVIVIVRVSRQLKCVRGMIDGIFERHFQESFLRFFGRF